MTNKLEHAKEKVLRAALAYCPPYNAHGIQEQNPCSLRVLEDAVEEYRNATAEVNAQLKLSRLANHEWIVKRGEKLIAGPFLSRATAEKVAKSYRSLP